MSTDTSLDFIDIAPGGGDLASETDNWLNEHRDQRRIPTTSALKSQSVEPERTTNDLSESITSINMAGELQKMSTNDNSDVSDNNNDNNLLTEKQWREGEEKKEDEETPVFAASQEREQPESPKSSKDQSESTAALEQPDQEQQEDQSASPPDSHDVDQMESNSVDQSDHQKQGDTESDSEVEESATPEVPTESFDNNDQSKETDKVESSSDSHQAASSAPPSPSAASAPPKESSSTTPMVETVTSNDSLDLLPTQTNSNAENIEDSNLSETAVASGADEEQVQQPPVVAEAVAMDQPTEAKPDDPQESRPSLAAQMAAAAASAATGILPVLSNLSSSPRGSPRSSPRPSPTRSTTTAASQDGNDQASTDTPSLAARAAAAAAAAATGIMPGLSGASPRVSPSAPDISISTARTWPDENAFLDNGQAVQPPVPSPPGSDVGVGGRVKAFPKLRPPSPSPVIDAAPPLVDLESPRQSSPAASPVASLSENPATTARNLEAGLGDSDKNDDNDEEAQVLSVVPTVIEADDFDDKDDEKEKLVNREVPLEEESGHHFKELDEDGPPSRCATCLAFLKTKKGIAVASVLLVVLIGIAVGVSVALSKPPPSYCDATRKGYSIPNENSYKQMDLNWKFDVSTSTKQWGESFLKDITKEFQGIIIPQMAGCDGTTVTVEDSRIINGYAVASRDTGDCAKGASRPCFRLLIDFAIWVREDYVNPFEMIGYLNDNFGSMVTDQIESIDIVQNVQMVALDEI